VEPTIPEPDFVAVGEKDERINAVSGLDPVSVVTGLTLALDRAAAGALRLHDAQRTAQAVGQGVVGKFVRGVEKDTWAVQHRRVPHQELLQERATASRPAGAGKLEVNPLSTCLRFSLHRLHPRAVSPFAQPRR
jgi:hypothetical protein